MKKPWLRNPRILSILNHQQYVQGNSSGRHPGVPVPWIVGGRVNSFLILGFPNKPLGFPTQKDHFGVWNGLSTGTTIYGNTHNLRMAQHTMLQKQILWLFFQISFQKVPICLHINKFYYTYYPLTTLGPQNHETWRFIKFSYLEV